MRPVISPLVLALACACGGAHEAPPGPPSAKGVLCAELEALLTPVEGLLRLSPHSATLRDLERGSGTVHQRIDAITRAAETVPDAALGTLLQAVRTFDAIVGRQPAGTTISQAGANVRGSIHNIGVAGAEVRDALHCERCEDATSRPESCVPAEP